MCRMPRPGGRKGCLALMHHASSDAHTASIIKIAEASVHFVLIFHQCLSELCDRRVKIRVIWHDPALAHFSDNLSVRLVLQMCQIDYRTSGYFDYCCALRCVYRWAETV